MIKNIVFDLGNVLLDYDPRRIVNAVFKDPQEQTLLFTEIFQSEGWRLLDQGLLTFEEHTRNLSSRYPQHAEEIDWLLSHWQEDVPPIPGMHELLGKLSNAGFFLFLLSNANTRNYTYQDYSPLFDLFSGLTFSSELHLLKPEIEIYNTFCQIHSLVPAECLFIDDKIENVQGAISAGWQAYQFIGVKELIIFLENKLGINLNAK
jgi:putative hydrolase of the HAD superfamily